MLLFDVRILLRVCGGLHYPEFLSLRGSSAWKAPLRAKKSERFSLISTQIHISLYFFRISNVLNWAKNKSWNLLSGFLTSKQSYFQFKLGVNHHHHHHHHINCSVWPGSAQSYKRLVISSPEPSIHLQSSKTSSQVHQILFFLSFFFF